VVEVDNAWWGIKNHVWGSELVCGKLKRVCGEVKVAMVIIIRCAKVLGVVNI
jgi:hypothetical protein